MRSALPTANPVARLASLPYRLAVTTEEAAVGRAGVARMSVGALHHECFDPLSIRETAGEAKVKAELLEKEVEGNRKVYALQIASLEETLKKQAEQIESLSAKLQVALTQAQELAMKAIEGTAHAHAARRGDAGA